MHHQATFLQLLQRFGIGLFGQFPASGFGVAASLQHGVLCRFVERIKAFLLISTPFFGNQA